MKVTKKSQKMVNDAMKVLNNQLGYGYGLNGLYNLYKRPSQNKVNIMLKLLKEYGVVYVVSGNAQFFTVLYQTIDTKNGCSFTVYDTGRNMYYGNPYPIEE